MKLPAFWSAIFLIAGIWIGHEIKIADYILFLIAIIFFVAGLIVYLKDMRRFSWLIIGAAILICGIFRVSLETGNPANNDISHFNDLGEKISIVGEIIREPDLRPAKAYLLIQADTLYYRSTAIPVSGRVMIKLNYFTSVYNYADYIRVRGYLSTPPQARNPGAFDYKKFLLAKNIRSIISIKSEIGIDKIRSQAGNIFIDNIVIPLRKKLLSVFDRYLSSPQKSLIAGFMIGETRFIPQNVFQNFRDTGTLHLLAVSGSNVALVIGTVVSLLILLRVPIKYRHIISLAVIILFSNLSYNQPSVIRASVMIGLYLIGKLAYRRVNYINIISVAAFVILMFNPMMLWDVGFQLSFSAAFGLIYFLPIIYERLSPKSGWAKKLPAFMLMTFLSSIVAQLAVAPVLAYHFNTIPLIGFISNLVIVPLSSLAVIMALILSLFWWLPSIAMWIGLLTDSLLKLTISSVNFFAALPVVKLNIASPDWIMVLLYYLTLIFAFQVIRKSGMIKYFIMTVLIMANMVTWRSYLGNLNNNPRLIVFDVGQNSMVYLKMSGKTSFLMGAISSKSSYNPIKHVLIPYCRKTGIGEIDRLIPYNDAFKLSVDSVFRNNGLSIDEISRDIGQDTGVIAFPSRDRVEIVQSESSKQIEMVIYEYRKNKILIINDLACINELPDLSPEFYFNIDILVMPEPLIVDKALVGDMLGINPKNIIFCSYRNRYVTAVGYDFLVRELKSHNINLFNVRDSGALSIEIRSSNAKISAASSDY